MSERIEVRFQHLGQYQGLPLYHQYIIYTDRNGTEWIARGGPANPNSPIMNPGKLTTRSGIFVSKDTEWLNRNTDARQILKTGDDLSAEWNAITDSLQAIDGIYDYSILGNNSNTTVRTALRDAGLPQPTETTPDGFPKYWSPGNEFITPPDPRPLFPFAKTHAGKWAPIVMDLDGCGFNFKSYADSGASFDFDGDGKAERVGWFGGDDGILVLDLNGNGQIDNGREMVGADQINAFNGLAKYDSNRDGWIDSKDASYSSFRIWCDIDGNARSDPSELRTLSQSNIAFIPIRTPLSGTDPEGNRINSQGIFSPVGLPKNTGHFARSVAVETALKSWTAPRGFKISAAAQKIPNLEGYGRLRDLNAEATLNATVLTLAQKLSTAAMGSGSFQSLQDSFEALIFAWAKVATISPNSRGQWVDARKVAFLSAFYDDPYYDQVPIKNANMGAQITDAYIKLRDSLFTRFLSGIPPLMWSMTKDEQQVYKSRFLPLMQLGLGADNQFTGQFQSALSAYFQILPKDGQAASVFAPLISGALAGAKRDFQISEEEYRANILAHVLQRQTDTKEIVREANYFFAFDAATPLANGRFNDFYGGQNIIWGGGSLFVGDNFDNSMSERYVDLLILPKVSFERVSFTLSSGSVVLQVTPSSPGLRDGGTITLENQTKGGVGYIAFADGKVMSWDDVRKAVLTSIGTSANDVIVGVSQGFSSEYDNDTINGLGGNDTLTGGLGDDTFVFQLSHGRDLVTDFDRNGDDVLEISTKLFSNWNAVAAAMKQVGQGAVITTSPTSSIRFLNDWVGNFTPDDVRFVA